MTVRDAGNDGPGARGVGFQNQDYGGFMDLQDRDDAVHRSPALWIPASAGNDGEGRGNDGRPSVHPSGLRIKSAMTVLG